jgi:hypothetical protein
MREYLITVFHFFSLIKGLSLYLLKIKFRSYPSPPSDMVNIGIFDKSLLIHTSEKYSHLFNNNNLHTETNHSAYKTGIISLELYGGKIFIKKTYHGTLRDKLKFYNEIDCLHRMVGLKNVPKIHFIEYNNLIIYIDFIDGENLERITRQKMNYSDTIISKAKVCSKDALKKIHENRVVVIDIQAHNILFNSQEQQAYFVDFADSIYFSLIFKKLMRFLSKRDEIQMDERVLKRL